MSTADIKILARRAIRAIWQRSRGCSPTTSRARLAIIPSCVRVVDGGSVRAIRNTVEGMCLRGESNQICDRWFGSGCACGSGEPFTVANAICIHEEDCGVLWKHVDMSATLLKYGVRGGS